MPDDVIVLAAGPSVRELNLRELETRGHLIAVNGASLYTKPHVAFTMDRLITQHCFPIWKIQGVPEIWLRRGVAKNVVPTGNTTQFEHEGKDSHLRMTFEHGKLNGSNSGTCAFNLALQRATKRIFLIGYDLIRFKHDCEPYWYPPFAWNTAGGSKDGNLREWAEEYVVLKKFVPPDVQVYNVNEPRTTRLTAFPLISYESFQRMTA